MKVLTTLAVTLPLLALPARSEAQTAPILTLAEALRAAERSNPELAAVRALAEATAARVPGAGRPPDPVVQVGVMNLALPELSASMPASMAPSVQAMQMLPVPGTLGRAERMADQTRRMADARVEERAWEIRAAVAAEFFTVYRIDGELEVVARNARLVADLREVAQARYASGEGPQADVLRAGVEVARLDMEIRRLESLRSAAVARLNARMGQSAQSEIPAVELPALPASTPTAEVLSGWAEEVRPALDEARTAVARARTGVEQARSALWPDATIGVQYGRRPTSSGGEHMVGAMVGFTIPVFARSRQLKGRDEARALAAEAEAVLQRTRVDVAAAIIEGLADLERARALLTLYRSEVVPLAEANAASALASYRAGAVDFMTVLEARLGQNEHERNIPALIADYGRALTRLEATVGRPMPLGETLAREER
ncbi:MAG: TolC family protein [Gemmatimonadota bacterium]